MGREKTHTQICGGVGGDGSGATMFCQLVKTIPSYQKECSQDDGRAGQQPVMIDHVRENVGHTDRR